MQQRPPPRRRTVSLRCLRPIESNFGTLKERKKEETEQKKNLSTLKRSVTLNRQDIRQTRIVIIVTSRAFISGRHLLFKFSLNEKLNHNRPFETEKKGGGGGCIVNLSKHCWPELRAVTGGRWGSQGCLAVSLCISSPISLNCQATSGDGRDPMDRRGQEIFERRQPFLGRCFNTAMHCLRFSNFQYYQTTYLRVNLILGKPNLRPKPCESHVSGS